MPTLILPPRITPDTDAMLEAAQAAGLNGRDVVLYGEPLFADVVAPSLGVALLQAPFDWLPGLPESYRRRQIAFTTLAAAREYPLPAFIKPADDKCFPARVYASGAELPDAAVLPDDTPVLTGEAVTWQVEYRCFVADRAVVTCSPYWRDGVLAQADDGTWPALPHEREAALAFARTLLADPAVAVPPAFVLDVGRIDDGGWAVVEANSAWGAGIYGCDPALVLQVLRRAVVPQERLPPDDLPWARALPEIEMDAPPGMPVPDVDGLITLYRPIGAAELAKIAASRYRAFPPRLSEQPIFYPVLNERYAAEIARSWNTRDAASGQVGHVTRFRVRAEHLARYVIQVAGAAHHQEYWIPAEELDAFNDAIVGPIEVIATYHDAEVGG
jgi:hypothetical protein